MQITIKTLQQQQFTLEVDPNETVASIKDKIEKSQNHPASWVRLIYSGKVLEDNVSIGATNIKDNEFLVMMVRKPKEEPAKAPSTPASTTASTQPEKPATQEKPAEVPQQTSEKPTPSTPAPQSQPQSTPSSGTGLVMGAEYEKTVAQLCDMGFPRDEVVRALRAAFNNPDRAVEYLFSGIPSIPDMPQPTPQRTQAPSTQSPQTPQSPQSSQPSISPTTPLIPPQFLGQQAQQQQQSGQPGVFDFLRQHPQFNALRMMVQQQPELLQPVLQQLGQANPAILQLINQHQQEFIQLLNEPIQPSSPGQSGQSGMPGMPPLGPQYIQVTPEEKAAIDRLEKLGFERSLVIEAFMACDKDEQLAANYLLEHLGEEFDDDTNQ